MGEVFRLVGTLLEGFYVTRARDPKRVVIVEHGTVEQLYGVYPGLGHFVARQVKVFGGKRFLPVENLGTVRTQCF